MLNDFGRQISSHSTWWHKHVSVCFLWMSAILVCLMTAMMCVGAWETGRDIAIALLLPIMPVFMCWATYRFWLALRGLADEVRLMSDHLLVVQGRNIKRILLLDITKVEASILKKPEIIMVDFKQADGTTAQFTFAARSRIWIYSRHPIINELQTCIALAKKDEEEAPSGA